jgi:hypothetical protein
MHDALAQRRVRIEILVDAPVSQRPRAQRRPHRREVKTVEDADALEPTGQELVGARSGHVG